jgi:hypothetical protein
MDGDAGMIPSSPSAETSPSSSDSDIATEVPSLSQTMCLCAHGQQKLCNPDFCFLLPVHHGVVLPGPEHDAGHADGRVPRRRGAGGSPPLRAGRSGGGDRVGDAVCSGA